MRFVLSTYFFLLLFFPLLMVAQIPIEPGVSQALAQARAQEIERIDYLLLFRIPEHREDSITAQLKMKLIIDHHRGDLLMDFSAPAGYIHSLVINHVAVPIQHLAGHLVLPKQAIYNGDNTVDILFRAGDMSLNRNEDYLYTLLVPDRASTLFPCFDQPDLKARFNLALNLPDNWVASSNALMVMADSVDGRQQVYFDQTQPISTYLFSFAAGKLGMRRSKNTRRPMTMYFRETDQALVDSNAAEIFDLHEQAIRWLEDYTGIRYPFQKLDFVLLPGFQYGGMEHVGNIFYREPSMLLEKGATYNRELSRASLIAHEVAHMWFGDLVTMRWFNDVWLKEVFANFMAAKIIQPAFPQHDHSLGFLQAHQPTAYAEDRSGGTHAIQQKLDNLRNAGSLYGGIIYQKAPIVMRQLEAYIGADTFQRGLQLYLDSFSFGNASWDDLIAILDSRSAQDVQAWSQVWVKEEGMPVMHCEWVNQEAPYKLRIVQEKKSPSGRYWTQRSVLAAVYADTVRTLPVRIEGAVSVVTLPADWPKPLAVFANASDMSYGYFRLDEASREVLLRRAGTLTDNTLRFSAWMALYEEFVQGRLSRQAFLEALLPAIGAEQAHLILSALQGYLQTVYWNAMSSAERVGIKEDIERLLWKRLSTTTHPSDASLQKVLYDGYLQLADTDAAYEHLYRIWNRQDSLLRTPLTENQEGYLALELALRRPEQSDYILQQQLERTKNPDRKAFLRYIQPALSGQETVRDQFFQRLKEEENRHTEPWVVDAVRYLNHPLRAEHAEKYILPSLELLEEIQRTGDIFFPRQFISAVLGGHQSARAAQLVRDFLNTHPTFPYQLRNKTLMAADMLFRVQGINKGARP